MISRGFNRLTTALVIFAVYLSSVDVSVSAKKKADHCEVCHGALTKFVGTLPDGDKTNAGAVENHFKKWCKTTKNKDQRFCYMIGGRTDS